jgi:AmmeMemoRadiSam system protein B
MNEVIRPSVLSGTWYPESKEELTHAIEGYFDRVKLTQIDGSVVGIIAPHAGYIYSGQVAAYGYKMVIGKSFDIVVILSPMHHYTYEKYIINAASHYETPIGEVAIDLNLVNKIKKELEISIVENETEHSIEIQLPFLQLALNDLKILPIMIGHSDVNQCNDIITALIKILNGKNALLVASSDMHHLNSYNEVKEKDKIVSQILIGFETKKIKSVLGRRDCTVCGRVPIVIAIETAKRLGAKKLFVTNQKNSGDVTNQMTGSVYTVGYLSAVIIKKS